MQGDGPEGPGVPPTGGAEPGGGAPTELYHGPDHSVGGANANGLNADGGVTGEGAPHFDETGEYELDGVTEFEFDRTGEHPARGAEDGVEDGADDLAAGVGTERDGVVGSGAVTVGEAGARTAGTERAESAAEADDRRARPRRGRPDRTPRSRGGATRLAEPIKAHARRPIPTLDKPGDRFQVLLLAALSMLALGFLAMVVVAAVAGLTAGAGPAVGALFGAAVPLWLAAHQVPLTLQGAPLGVLPLLPTVGMVWLVVRTSAAATRRLGGRWREDCVVVAATLTGSSASAAVLATALPAGTAQTTPWAAFVGAGLVTAVGAGLGALRIAGAPAWWWTAPPWVHTGLAAARIAAAALAVAGSLLLVSALLVDASQLRARVESAGPDTGALLGITLLSLCYLPNALVAAVGWVLGPGISIGAAAASQLLTRPGPLPGLPLMAAMPAIRPPAWTVVVFLLPVVAGVLIGLRCRRAGGSRAAGLRSAALASALVALGVAVLADVVSGRLGGGPFDPVELSGLATGAAAFGWLAVPSVVVVLLPGARARLG
jgi:hypothetical protein